MGWLSSWFSPNNNMHNTRKGQALSSTHEAFSLPTSSPGLLAHPDAFNPDMLGTAEPDSATSPFTYPPQSASYSYSPTSIRPTSILPLYHQNSLHTPHSSPVNYPPLAHTWNRLRTWLAREYPEMGDTLNYGILPQDLAQIELQFGFPLPAVVRESYLAADGQEAESSAGCPEGLFFGLTLLPLEDVLEEWRFWRDVEEDPATGANQRLRQVMRSIPSNWIRTEYTTRGWVPLIADKGGNYIGVDLNPGDGGIAGQVIVFGRDFDTKVVLWRGDGASGWAKWLASFVDELESGEGFEVGTSGNEYSEGSEDGVGYESYFHDGSGRGQGDGGGDSGAGGLRLTGEYRGWSPLEAWADRSVRKWYEAGVDVSIPQSSEKTKERAEVGLGVGAVAGGSATEVVIPVVAETQVDDSSHRSPPTPISGVANSSRVPTSTSSSARPSPRHQPPTLSISKPPAPLPVQLPSPNDIVPLPSPPHTASLLDTDLEAGRRVVMREVAYGIEGGHGARQMGMRSLSRDASNIPLPKSPPPSDLIDVISPPSAPSHSPLDLLTDAAPVLETAAIEPSTRSGVSPSVTQAPSAGGEEVTPPPTSIRLVGGGGLTNETFVIADDDLLLDGDANPDEAEEAAPDKQGKHEKKKSITSGLKKLGNLGVGGRRKDSDAVAMEQA